MGIFNGKTLYATDGSVLHAHGAGFLEADGYYYMFGEVRDKSERVNCYRSRDLMNWEFRACVLSLDSHAEPYYVRTTLSLKERECGANIERPKVIYCEKTKKYVMWMHYENGLDYNAARCAVASCDTPDGEYTYHGSFNPVGNMSRDCTLFVDDDKTAYFISAARDNADMIIYRLTDDYMAIDEQVKTLWSSQYREAPAIFKRGKYYFMITSMCTGWFPNQCAYAVAEKIDGRWSSLRPFGPATAFNTQPTYVIKLGGSYIYVGDRWDPADYNNSTYAFLPIEFDAPDSCFIQWAGETTIDVKKKDVRTIVGTSDAVRLSCSNYREYLASDGYDVFGFPLGYANEELLWSVENEGERFRLRHIKSGKYLTSEGIVSEGGDSPAQRWKAKALGKTVQLVNAHTKKALTVHRRRVILTDGENANDGFYIVPEY
ncbi:MAG: family 43 glycosylhydrolase [Clostridia bacterium]|nr:family 43 glycosylhydrolase [Clostridia bacterium]